MVAQLYPSGAGFPFRRVLRLAGLRWRYSNPPPQGVDQHAELIACLIDTTPTEKTLRLTVLLIVACVFIDGGMCLHSCCLVTAISSGSTVPVFGITAYTQHDVISPVLCFQNMESRQTHSK
jgi:hypothetical protein